MDFSPKLTVDILYDLASGLRPESAHHRHAPHTHDSLENVHSGPKQHRGLATHELDKQTYPVEYYLAIKNNEIESFVGKKWNKPRVIILGKITQTQTEH